MFRLRAGVRAGRLAASLSRIGLSARLARFGNLMALRLCVLTVQLFRIVRRMKSRERSGTAVFSTRSKGPMRGAIRRATCGLTPRGMNPGKAAPDLCEVEAVAANTAWICLFLDGWSQPRISPPHACMDSVAVIVFSTVSPDVSGVEHPLARVIEYWGVCQSGAVLLTCCIGRASW